MTFYFDMYLDIMEESKSNSSKLNLDKIKKLDSSQPPKNDNNSFDLSQHVIETFRVFNQNKQAKVSDEIVQKPDML